MSKISKSVSSIILIVAFLVLTAITVVLYGGSDDQKEKMEGSFLYNQGRAAIDGLWTLAWGIVNLGSKEINNGADQTGGTSERTESDAKTGFWPELMEKIKEEWENPTTAETAPFERLVNWVETENGGILIFRTKTDKEYKLPLSFRFLKSREQEMPE